VTAASIALPPNSTVHHIEAGDRVYTLHYPESPQMRVVIEHLFGLVDYPRIECLGAMPGAIVDIGANIGATALLFRLLYPNAPIYAFEPSPSTYAYLKENAAQVENLRTFNVGLFDRDAETRLYTGAISVTSSVSSSVFNGASSESIVLLRASRALEELGVEDIALLKIDTEGAEVAILRDLEHRLDRIAAIAVEYHSEQDRREIDNLLASRFAVYTSHAERPHLGTVIYVAKEIIAQRTDAERFAIPRPRL
jgi:FkbM family methyltransferase